MLKFSLGKQDFTLRHLSQMDTEKYLVFFNELSEESIRCRFGYLISKLPESAAEQRTTVNTESEKAVAIFEGHQNRIVAIGRCYIDDKTAEAEIALVVSETMRRLGLGRFLLDQLIEIAQEEKCRLISAFLATENAPIIKLLQSAGFLLESTRHGNDLKLVLKISLKHSNGTSYAVNGERKSVIPG